MRVCVLICAFVSGLLAADPQQLALVLRAQSDYDKVELAPTPQLGDTSNCEQSQAAALSVSAPEETALLYFRKGYCTLLGAIITSNHREFLTAATDFDR